MAPKEHGDRFNTRIIDSSAKRSNIKVDIQNKVQTSRRNYQLKTLPQ